MRLIISIIAITISVAVLISHHAVAETTVADCKNAANHQMELACGQDYYNKTPERIEWEAKWLEKNYACERAITKLTEAKLKCNQGEFDRGTSKYVCGACGVPLPKCILRELAPSC